MSGVIAAILAGNAGKKDKIVATGGTVYTNGDYKIHVFTSTATFAISEVNDSTALSDVFLVGGGYDGQGGDSRECNYNGGNGGNGGDGGYWKKYENYQFSQFFGSSPANITITVGARNDSSSGFTSGGGYWAYNGLSKAGGAGGGGGNMGTWGYNGQFGGNGLASESVNWISGTTIYGGASGGGGGGGAYNVWGGDSSPGLGGSGGDNGGGGGGGGGSSNGNDPGNGSDGGYASNYGGGGGGGGGASGEPQCVPEYTGGMGGEATDGVVVIRYKFR